MYRAAFAVPLAISACAMLAACTGNYPDYPEGGRHAANERLYRVYHHGNETDYVMLDQVLFRTDSAELGPHAADMVADVAAEARRHPHVDVVVDGYTDTTGTPGYNKELSEARAASVAAELRSRGVSGARISTHGYGESHLAVPTGDGVKEAENRRVVIRLIDQS